jgi:cytochrome oxidase Cu insertion factor (SCO1/SenC/PrrC family)
LKANALQNLIAAVVVSTFSLLMLPLVANGATVTKPPASVGVATSEPLPAAVANAKFVNELGKSVTLAGLKGKTVMIVPVLTLCGDTCPFTTGNLLQLQELIAKAQSQNIELVGITVDPFRDTAARLDAYGKLIGLNAASNFQLWTPAGRTSTPMAPMGGSMSQGTGDQNQNLSAVVKFLGWSIQVVDEMKPAMVDWMTGKKLTYDISHSDGFWIMDAKQVVRFASGTSPGFTGTIAKKLATFMGAKSNIYKVATPAVKGWTPREALEAISWVVGQPL